MSWMSSQTSRESYYDSNSGYSNAVTEGKRDLAGNRMGLFGLIDTKISMDLSGEFDLMYSGSY